MEDGWTDRHGSWNSYLDLETLEIDNYSTSKKILNSLKLLKEILRNLKNVHKSLDIWKITRDFRNHERLEKMRKFKIFKRVEISWKFYKIKNFDISSIIYRFHSSLKWQKIGKFLKILY